MMRIVIDIDDDDDESSDDEGGDGRRDGGHHDIGDADGDEVERKAGLQLGEVGPASAAVKESRKMQ